MDGPREKRRKQAHPQRKHVRVEQVPVSVLVWALVSVLVWALTRGRTGLSPGPGPSPDSGLSFSLDEVFNRKDTAVIYPESPEKPGKNQVRTGSGPTQDQVRTGSEPG
ncbi:hypothetical protein WMY93_002289 [Mugilogobius chulae]|uniref:Uncharacterized protein n=1 Tax=Mugilogobius chulae TaxID=88201 RepID=A0AAW0PTG2_9GOBI